MSGITRTRNVNSNISGLLKQTSYFDAILFADDTNPFIESRYLNLQIIEINIHIDNLLSWCNQNKRCLNVDTIKYVLMKDYQNLFTLNSITLLNGFEGGKWIL